VGAGIVADSSPESEYEETLKKAGAMFKAIEKVKDNDFAN
jgi:anthranilate/para-aminobenzoate synthase component I